MPKKRFFSVAVRLHHAACLVMAGALGLAGCGQKGALMLPKSAAAAAPAAASAPAR